jgi:hypothetical protein
MAITRCHDCNATLKADELRCYGCGTAVEGRSKSKFGAGFTTFVTILFFLSGILTVASLFVEATPGFTKCLMVTVVLLVVRTSAGEMDSSKT